MSEKFSNSTIDSTYTIYFRGETLNNLAPALAKQNLAQLFKLPPEKIEPLFSGQTVALKKNIDQATADKFQMALKNAGLKVYLQAVATNNNTSNPQTTTQENNPVSHNTLKHAAGTTTELQLLAVGSDVLTASERHTTASVNINTSHLALAPVGSLPTSEKPTVPAPDVSHITLAKNT